MKQTTGSIHDRAKSVVFAAIDSLNEMLAAGQRVDKSPETVLVGATGNLDSAAFINLLVLLEEKCEEEFGVTISLSDDGPGGEDNPFASLAALVRHLEAIVQDRISAN
jgi:acyl carrier protein